MALSSQRVSDRSTVDNHILWRLWHSFNFMLGGTLFISASVCYYPWSYNDVKGGILFSIGSANLLFADITEWSHYRFKQHLEQKINCFLSIIGSFLYLVGSILFIP